MLADLAAFAAICAHLAVWGLLVPWLLYVAFMKWA